MSATLEHPIFLFHTPREVLDGEEFNIICPECKRPGHEDGHDPRMCILKMWRRGEVESFDDWMPLARAEAERARAQATAFLAAPAQLAPQACSATAAQTTQKVTQRKCSQCRQPGHTKRTCSVAAATAPTPSPASQGP